MSNVEVEKHKNLKPGTGNWKPGTGNSEPGTGNCIIPPPSYAS
jgi:hypothetical protein